MTYEQRHENLPMNEMSVGSANPAATHVTAPIWRIQSGRRFNDCQQTLDRRPHAIVAEWDQQNS
ncbi:hypothetical protein PHMEG_0008963 [Phytophthora megakarya]|uniref:Uncharacterized protein n=1 Tax=Phytophthora megakarya TaxID=4795 RepID=A0A225WJF1_9STRA|nr:hypothetical protein PHMEG_0008963 [Phytophthora megakarya]